VPQKSVGGKNSADIRLVVDAMDMSFQKEHINCFVICSGDSDFSPLVSKLKENNKYVIGLGVKNSTSELLIENCDEFIFYEDLVRVQARPMPVLTGAVPEKLQDCFNLLVDSVLALQRENKEVLWGSMVKETMKRKKPSFNETYYGFRSFSHLLEDAQRRGIVVLRRDQKSGSYIIEDLGGAAKTDGTAAAEPRRSASEAAAPAEGDAARSSRRRRGRGGRGRRTGGAGGAGSPARGRAPTRTTGTRRRTTATSRCPPRTADASRPAQPGGPAARPPPTAVLLALRVAQTGGQADLAGLTPRQGRGSAPRRSPRAPPVHLGDAAGEAQPQAGVQGRRARLEWRWGQPTPHPHAAGRAAARIESGAVLAPERERTSSTIGAQRHPQERRVGLDRLHRGVELDRDLGRAQLGEQVLEVDRLATDLAAAEGEERAAVVEGGGEDRRELHVLLLEPRRGVGPAADLPQPVAQRLDRRHEVLEAAQRRGAGEGELEGALRGLHGVQGGGQLERGREGAGDLGEVLEASGPGRAVSGP
jgi:hypothetical protein